MTSGVAKGVHAELKFKVVQWCGYQETDVPRYKQGYLCVC